MDMDSSRGRRPVATRNFTIRIPATRKDRIVATMAIPPPRAIMVRWYLSSVGRATKPARAAMFLTRKVRIAETANDASNRIIAKLVSDIVSIVPVNGSGQG